MDSVLSLAMNLFSKMCFLFWQGSTWQKQEGTIGENKLKGTNIKEMEKLDFSRRDGTCANSPCAAPSVEA